MDAAGSSMSSALSLAGTWAPSRRTMVINKRPAKIFKKLEM